MADSIFKRQNESYLLDCLLEQRKRYTFAKRLQRAQSIIMVALSAFSAISSATGLELLTAIYGLVSVIVLVANKYYGKWIASVKRKAATIQQFFDVVLFSAAVGNSELEWGNCPSRIDIAKHIGDYTGRKEQA